MLYAFSPSIFRTHKNYQVCDSDYDGIYTFSANDRAQIIQQNTEENEDNSEVYITSFADGILKIKNVGSANPSLEYVCKVTTETPNYYEIAINSKKELYFTADDRIIYKIDELTCAKTPVSLQSDDYMQALSFDRNDNLYKSNGTSEVSRAAFNDFDNFEIWHDFGSGAPSGDFVMVGDKMYISWTMSSFSAPNDLYEVTVDGDFNYVSHINLGKIKNDTWGLAWEFGKLYGVTKDELYEININDLSTRTVFLNPSSSSNKQWWGAAGKHEAQIIDHDLCESHTDAENNINSIQFPYQNKIPVKQTVYLRSTNRYSGETKIVPIDLQINLPPFLDIQENYVLCFNGDYTSVTVDSKLSAEGNTFKWYYENVQLPNDSPILSTQQPGNYSLKVINNTTGCTAEKNFALNQSDIKINNVTNNHEFLFIDASGTDFPFDYTVDDITQENQVFNYFPLGELSI